MSQGRKRAPEPSLFSYLDPEQLYRHIPKANFYEQLARVLDLEFVRELTAPLYADRVGRPSLDPVVFFRAMLVGFFENIVADTELEFRLADSLLLRRFLGYALDERTPDESTLRKTRQKMPEELFALVFERVLGQCAEQGLLRGRALGGDSTLVDANASLDSLTHRELGCRYEQYMLALRRQDAPEADFDEAKRADRGRPGKGNNAVWRSASDPEARVAVHADKHTHLSYRLDATVDLETGVIVAAGATTADQQDQETCLPRVDQACENLAGQGLAPTVFVADKGHHAGENLAGLEERGLIALVSAPAPSGPAGFRLSDFVWDADSDTYRCPAGQLLTYRSTHQGRRVYRLRGAVCRACPHFGQCTTSRGGRTLSANEHQGAMAANAERVHSAAARPLMMIRRQRGERPFGYFKQYGGLRRLNGRGLAHAEKKVLLAAIGWNLLLMVKAAMAAGGTALGWLLGWLVRSVAALGRVTDPSSRTTRSRPTALAAVGWTGCLSGGC